MRDLGGWSQSNEEIESFLVKVFMVFTRVAQTVEHRSCPLTMADVSNFLLASHFSNQVNESWIFVLSQVLPAPVPILLPLSVESRSSIQMSMLLTYLCAPTIC